jgi:pullulanase/glycogen debranching enzyme
VGRVRPGSRFPLGATPEAGGTNFAVSSGVADGMLLCLFDDAGAETRVALPEYDAGVWHGFVGGVGAGQAYGYRATGPWDPARGVRCNPAKLLLDPYARATAGAVRFGPEVLDHDAAEPDRASQLDSAGHVPAAWWSTRPPAGPAAPGHGTATPTPSSTRCTSRGSPCAIPGCRRRCAAPTPGWPTTPPSPTWSTSG